MRKIVSPHDEAKRRKRNQIILGAMLIFVMLFSTLGYSLSSGDSTSERKVDFNGYDFFYEGSYWRFPLGQIEFIFLNSPHSMIIPETEVKAYSLYSGKPLYIHSENAEAEIEIARNFYPVVGNPRKACYTEENCPEEIPIKTCEDNFIIIKESNSTLMYQEDNCVYLIGPAENLTKIADGFILKSLNIV